MDLTELFACRKCGAGVRFADSQDPRAPVVCPVCRAELGAQADFQPRRGRRSHRRDEQVRDSRRA